MAVVLNMWWEAAERGFISMSVPGVQGLRGL